MLKNEIEKYELEVHRILSDETVTLEETLEKLSNLTEKYNKLADRELRQYIAKQSLGLALELGSAILPIGGVAKAGGAISKQALKSVLGRKISERLGQGIASGLAGGGVFGFGSGIANDRNPLKESLKDATIGGITGGVFAGAGANAEKVVSAKLIKKYGDIDNLPSETRKKYNKDTRKFYQDYVQERNLYKDGRVNFSKAAVQEQLRWNPQQGQNYDGLIKDLKNAKFIGRESNLKPTQKPYVLNYDVYQGKNGLHYIEKLKDGTRRYYITKDTLNGTPPTTSGGSNKSVINNIPDNAEEFNMVKRLVNKYTDIENTSIAGPHATSTGANGSAINNIPDNAEEFNMVKRLVREVINENSAKSAQILTKSADLNRIFTADEIAKMSKEEFMNFESMINKQINSGYGIPQRLEAEEAVQSGDLIWVEGYVRSDGTEVKGYFRKK